MSLIASVEHAYATGISDLKKMGRVIITHVLPILKDAAAQAPTIEAISGLVSPQLANIERVGEAALGALIKAIEDGAAAGAAGAVNVSLDAQLVADIKAISPAVKAAASQYLASVPKTAAVGA